MKEFEHPLSAQAQTTVDSDNFASTVKSGSLDVFATPMMVALMEQATCKACEALLDEGETTVGTKISVTHDKASLQGNVISANATLKSVDGRRLCFTVNAKDSMGNIIGSGEIERFVVNAQRFMERLGKQ